MSWTFFCVLVFLLRFLGSFVFFIQPSVARDIINNINLVYMASLA